MAKKINNITLPGERAYQLKPITIVNDGAIATAGTALGRLVPLLILDSSDRPDIADVIEAHTVQSAGDVDAVWGNPTGSKADQGILVHLILHFIRPIDSYLIIGFDNRRSGLVDQIVRSRLVYIQGGRPGDRLSNRFDASRILVEVRDTGFEEIWERMFFKATFAEFRSRGLNKKQSVNAAREAISMLRELGDIRMQHRERPNKKGEA
jgi:hypothetical protein